MAEGWPSWVHVLPSLGFEKIIVCSVSERGWQRNWLCLDTNIEWIKSTSLPECLEKLWFKSISVFVQGGIQFCTKQVEALGTVLNPGTIN